MSSLFLFGAGASYGSGPCTPCSPPLGSMLFDELRKSGGVASEVGEDLAQCFRDDFEVGMGRFWAEHNVRATELLRDMARYFAQFETLPGNLYYDLLKVLGGTKKKAVLATTNYDLLIEQSITKFGLQIAYGCLPVVEQNVPVLKIHGSCHFLPNLNGGSIRGLRFDLKRNENASIIEAGVLPASSAREVMDFCDKEDSIAPAIAMYNPEKRVLYCSDFVRRQQDAFRVALRASSRVYVIGLRVHPVDQHIWQPLANSKAPIYYVGQEPQSFLSWASLNKRKAAFCIADSFYEGLKTIRKHH